MLRTLLLALTLATPGLARAASGPDVLAQVDANANATTDFKASVTGVTQIPGKGDKTLAFDLYTAKGKRLVDFKAPGDMKGTRVLVLSRTQMYVWLPSYNKIRRVASHVSDQGFMGTTFSDADMSTSVYAEVYTAALASEDDAAWTLALTRKEGEKSPYSKIEMVVRKDFSLPSELRYFNDKGEHVKTETRAYPGCEGPPCIPEEIKMVDHTRSDMSTTLTQDILGINTGLDEGLFSQRTLQRGL